MGWRSFSEEGKEEGEVAGRVEVLVVLMVVAVVEEGRLFLRGRDRKRCVGGGEGEVVCFRRGEERQ